MRYARILSAVAGTPWAIHPAKGQAIMDFLAFQAGGGKYAPAEVAAVIGRVSRHAQDHADDVDDERRIEQQRHARAAEEDRAIKDRGGIAIVSLRGVISPRLADEMDVSGPGGTSAEGFIRRFNAQLNDQRVAGIIIDADTPGGSVFGVPEAFSAMFASRGTKPVVVVASPFVASAGYWIAAGAEEVVITPSGEVGSIGVYSYHEDLSKALEKAGVTPTLIKADISPNKAETHPAFPLTESAIENVKESADRYGRQFVSDVARGRGIKPEAVLAKFGGGRMLGAEDALAAGMVDRIATLDQEIQRMAQKIGKTSGGKASTAGHRRRLALA